VTLTSAPYDPPEGHDSGFALFAKDRRTCVDDGTNIAWTLLPAADGVAAHHPVVAVNGWSCSDAYWVHIAPALAGLGHPVLLVDARGHGASGLPRHPGRGARELRPDDITIGRLARDLVEIADAAGIERAVVMGHSMGVQVALELDRTAPERVAGLVLIAGSYENPLKTFMGMPFADMVFPMAKLAVTTVPAAITRLAMAPARLTAFGAWAAKQARATGPKAKAADMAPYLRHIAAADTAVMIRTLDAMRRHSAADHLRRVTVPTLILAAERDTFTPPRCSTHMFERIPTAEIQWFPEAGHTLPIEEPEAIVAHIAEWHDRRVEPG
jgi:pimeloyl-ACP methyl ester carboxylesterase